MIEAIEVDVLSISDLADRVGLREIDMLHLDVEGYEFELLSNFPFDRVRPAIILYESFHLTDAHKSALRRKLQDHRYVVAEIGMDTLAECSGSHQATVP